MELIKISEKILIFLLLLFLSGCTDSSHDSSVQAKVDSEHPGMILVEATGESTTLGTNDAAAASNAKPAMKVKFTYDFSISKSEVTRSEYAALMEKNSSIASLVTITELFRTGEQLIYTTFRSFEVYTVVAVLYLIMNSVFMIIADKLEKRMARQ